METIEEFVKDLLKTDKSGGVLEIALTPKSAGVPNNERLEFLGNAILNLRLAEAIYHKDHKYSPGMMSLMCNYLRSNPVLVNAGRDGGLTSMLTNLPSNEEGKVTDKMVSTAFEAIIGALYERNGYEASSLFIDRFLITDELIASSINGKGPITELKELVDRDRELVIHSTSERTEGGLTIFCHSTTVNGKTVSGEGRTKKAAEAKAAAKALVGILPVDRQ